MKISMRMIPRIEKKASRLHLKLEELAGMIDHTLLQPYEGRKAIERLCEEASKYRFRCVCVHPYWLKLSRVKLAGTGVGLATVVGFPHGLEGVEAKVEETRLAIKAGADEIDMVMNIAAFLDGMYTEVEREIEGVVKAADGKVVKVILETGFLTYEQVIKACKIVKSAGADFVKTSTGFGPMGATVLHVFLMRKAVGRDFGVKASGGIRSFRDALRMIAAGANRIGTSAGVAIIEGYKKEKNLAWIPEIPCNLCPSGKLDPKIPPTLYQYYSEKCIDCPFRKYRLKSKG
ncbi:MAG: deoxyribose-phosphate aldolase [Candidatus Hadarchaeales archaeon]